MVHEQLLEAEILMDTAVESLKRDLNGYRTGRASPALLDHVIVEVYGTEVPLNQVATVSVPEPQQLGVRPYDANTLTAIERAIMKSDLGVMPNNDGKIIRINLPRLTEERRLDLTKRVNKDLEDYRVSIRNIRRDVIKELQKLQKEGDITEDQLHRGQDAVQKLTDKYIGQIDEIGKAKNEEIMEV